MPDSRTEFSSIIDDCFAAFDRTPLHGTKEVFWNVLQRFGIDTVRKAFKRWIETGHKVPSPAAIKKLAFDVAAKVKAKEIEGDADAVGIERMYAYCRPQSGHNAQGNPHRVTLPESIARRRPGETALQYEYRISNEITLALYPRLRHQFQRES